MPISTPILGLASVVKKIYTHKKKIKRLSFRNKDFLCPELNCELSIPCHINPGCSRKLSAVSVDSGERKPGTLYLPGSLHSLSWRSEVTCSLNFERPYLIHYTPGPHLLLLEINTCHVTGASREPYYENLPSIFSNMFSSASGHFSCLEDTTK